MYIAFVYTLQTLAMEDPCGVCAGVHVCAHAIEIVLLWISPDFTNNLTYSKSNRCSTSLHDITRKVVSYFYIIVKHVYIIQSSTTATSAQHAHTNADFASAMAYTVCIRLMW